MQFIKRIKSKWDSIPLMIKVSISYTICSIFQKSITFLTLPIFTRILSKEEYGQCTVYSSWSSIIIIFLTLNLAYGSFSTAMIKFEDRRDEYIASVEGICLFLSVIFLGIYLSFRSSLNKIFDLPTGIIILMVIEILAQTGIQLWSGKKRFEFKYKGVIVITIITYILAPISAYLFIINMNDKGIAKIVGYSAITIIIGGILFGNNIFKGKRIFNKELWTYAFRFNMPLMVYYLSQVIFNQSDRIMINDIMGAGDAAMYGVAYNLAVVLTFILNAINNAYVPWYYKKISQGKQEENRNISCGIAIIMALMLLGVIWYAPEIIYIMAGSQYETAVGVVAPVAMSLLFLFYTQLFINVEFYYEEKSSLIFASIGAALINIILNAILIPRLGFIVAGYTTLLSYIIFACSNCFTMRRMLKRKNLEDNAYSYMGLIGIIIVFIVVGFLGVVLYSELVIRLIITVIALIVFLKNNKKIIEIIKEIKS